MSINILLNPNVKFDEELKLNCNELSCVTFNSDNFSTDTLTANTINSQIINSTDIVSDEVKAIDLSCDTLFQKQAFAVFQSQTGLSLPLAILGNFYPIIGTPILKLPDNNLFVYNNTPGRTSQYGIILDGLYIIESYVAGINGGAIATLASATTINSNQPTIYTDCIDFAYSVPANTPFSFYNTDIQFVNAGTLMDISVACTSQGNATISLRRWYIRLTKIG